MNTDHDRAEDLLNQALALGPHQRTPFLAGICGADKALQEKVEGLLKAYGEAGGFLPETPAVKTALPAEGPGTVIDKYKLLEKLGEGGCGIVYMAEQEEPVRRKVALKVIKLGMDTKQVVARFEAERQALALMDHANIAKVLDAGATDTGRPYFVMELVGGIKITDYCNQKNLTTGQRLDLFIQVCHAVQHAHQKGVIHRDIKPSNVLVGTQDGVPVPKVIDFGIAKATQGRLTDQTFFTAFEQFIGTPAYMSPEQAQVGGLDIDTRSDIYSLGVLLYELLTGKTPFDAKELLAVGFEAMRKTICEKEPPTPSTRLAQERLDTRPAPGKTEIVNRSSEIDRELDWIVMKCLEKDRARRYETANGLARDVERHLNNEPVAAGRPSRLYRFQKAVRRNKGTAIATLVVAFVLVLGVIGSTWQAWRATRADRRSLQEAVKSQQVARFLTEMLEGVGPSKSLGRDATMLKEILDRTAERLGKELTNQPQVEAELRATLAETYRYIGMFTQMEAMAQQCVRAARASAGERSTEAAKALTLLGEAQDKLGNYVQSEATLRTALALHQQLQRLPQREVAETLNDLGIVLIHEGKRAEATRTLAEALAMLRKLKPGGSPEEAAVLAGMATSSAGQGRTAEAEGLLRESLAIARKWLGDEHPQVAGTLHDLAALQERQGKLALAETTEREALALKRKLLGNEHPDVALSLRDLAQTLDEEGKLEEAEAVGRESLAIARKALGDTHVDVAVSLRELASILTDEGKPTEAAKACEEALAIQRRVLGDHHEEVAGTLNSLGLLLRMQHKFREAENRLRESLAVFRNALGPEHSEVAAVLFNLGLVLRDEARLAEAEAPLREALAIDRKALGNAHPDLASVLVGLANCLSDQRKLAEAEPLYREALAIQRQALGPDHPKLSPSLAQLALNLMDQGKFPEAETLAREAFTLSQQMGCQHPHVIRTLNILALILQEQSKWTQVEAVYQESLPAIRVSLPTNELQNALQLSVALDRFAYSSLKNGKFLAAESLARESLAIRENKFADEWLTFKTRALVGASLLGQSNYAAAEPFLLSGYAGMKQREQKVPAGGRPILKENVQRLVQLYESTGRTGQAGEWKLKLQEFDQPQADERTAAAAAETSPK